MGYPDISFSLKANNKMWNICCSKSQVGHTVCTYTVPGKPRFSSHNHIIYIECKSVCLSFYYSEFCITATSSQTTDSASGTCGTAYKGGQINITKIASNDEWFGETQTLSPIPASFENYIYCMPYDSVKEDDRFVLQATNTDGVSIKPNNSR